MTEINTNEIRAEMNTPTYPGLCWFNEMFYALCDALDEARTLQGQMQCDFDAMFEKLNARAEKAELDAQNYKLERDHAHREVADRTTERDYWIASSEWWQNADKQSQAAVERVRKLRNLWAGESESRGWDDKLFTSGVVNMLDVALDGAS